MKEKSALIPKGIAGKMIRFFIIFAIVMGATYMVVFAIQLGVLQMIMKSDEKEQLRLVAGRSEESLTTIIEENLKARIKWAADRTDDELWIAGHNIKMLQNQVEDIYRHPENYSRCPVYTPKKENAGKPSLQLLCSDGYENISPEALERVERLANLEPILREFLIQNDHNVNIGIATMDGLYLDMDRLAEYKINDDGSVISLDVTDQVWYKGAIERGEVFFYPIQSLIYDFT